MKYAFKDSFIQTILEHFRVLKQTLLKHFRVLKQTLFGMCGWFFRPTNELIDGQTIHATYIVVLQSKINPKYEVVG